MIRLKDRLRQIPGGLKFFQAATKWSPYPFSSFDTIVRGLIEHRRANPFLVKQHNWALDYNTVADEVDYYNAKICESKGWTQYIVETGGPAPPKPIARSIQRSVGNAAGGVRLLADWLGPGGKPVASELSARRAAICSGGGVGQKCVRNTQGDWTAFFTVPASEMIRKQLSIRHDMALETPDDEHLGVCEACDCPLKLKVHAPLEHIRKNMPEHQKADLVPFCWILNES